MPLSESANTFSALKEPWFHWIFSILGFAGGIVSIIFGSEAETNHHSLMAVFLVALGTLLAGTIAVSVIVEKLLADSRARVVGIEVKKALTPIIFSGVQYGVYAVKKNTDTDFRDLFANLDSRDELLWLDTAAPQSRWYRQHIDDLLRLGCQIRILVLDPTCENARHRAVEAADQFKDPSRAVDLYQKLVESDLDALRSVADRLNATGEPVKGSLRVAQYQDLPGVPMYLIRRNGQPVSAWTSFFLNTETYDQVHFGWGVVIVDDCMICRFVEYFDRKWDRTVEVEGNLLIDVPRLKSPFSGPVVSAVASPPADPGSGDPLVANPS